MEFAIVPMTSAHLEQIEALEKICFSDPWSRKTLEDMVSNESAVNLAAVDPAGLVLGYISLCRVLAQLRRIHKAEGVCFRRKLVDAVADGGQLPHDFVKFGVGLLAEPIAHDH